jgi:hypothetical protein
MRRLAQAINNQEFDLLSVEPDDEFDKLLQSVIEQSYKASKIDQVACSLFSFLVRISNSWRSIRTLRLYSMGKETFLVDVGMLLRAMYDAYLQAEYIVADAGEARNRAQHYFEFEHVEL